MRSGRSCATRSPPAPRSATIERSLGSCTTSIVPVSAVGSTARAGSTPREMSSSRRSAPATSPPIRPCTRARAPAAAAHTAAFAALPPGRTSTRPCTSPPSSSPSESTRTSIITSPTVTTSIASSLPGSVCGMSGGWLQRGTEVSIRSLEAADQAAFLAAVRGSRRLHRPWVYPPDNPADFSDLLERPDGRTYLICRNEDEALAGCASLGHIVFGGLRGAYLGYSAFVPHQGKGYMTEGLRLVLRHGFRTLGLHRIEANVQPENVRSIALVERLGFRREGYSPRYLKIGGRWRDHVRYAMLAEEFGLAA